MLNLFGNFMSFLDNYDLFGAGTDWSMLFQFVLLFLFLFLLLLLFLFLQLLLPIFSLLLLFFTFNLINIKSVNFGQILFVVPLCVDVHVSVQQLHALLYLLLHLFIFYLIYRLLQGFLLLQLLSASAQLFLLILNFLQS